MSQYERHGGTRDLTLSRWHRQALRQYASSVAAGEACGMIDVDCLEYCARCGINLFLAEFARDVGQSRKATTQIERLAGSANIPAYCVLYTPVDDNCPYDRRCRDPQCLHGVVSFRVKQVAPDEARTDWKEMEPAEFAKFVLDFHAMHERMVCRSAWMGEAA